ncbi:MAG: HAMP domain-containing histidine kinase [Anaerolineales bacterium]|nr:HAMP domain-containing histidine kinase [Anaerolineales bacterium]
MVSESPKAGLTLLCDTYGTILQVLSDTLGLGQLTTVGQPLPLLVDRASFQKALSFLIEVRTHGATFDWEMNLPLAGQIITLHFAGLVLDDYLLIMAARTNNGVKQLYEDLMRVNHEQVHLLRQALKHQSELIQAQIRHDNCLYDEISRLNNELINLQRELAQKNVRLERLNQQKNQFLGMAAHDLRSPLGIIQTYSEFLLNETDTILDEQHLTFISTIRDSSKFMLGLVNNLLDIAAIESGQLKLELQLLNLSSIINRNLELNRVLASAKQIDLEFCHQESRLEVMADAPKLEQVLNNLITNAVKFSPPRRPVAVKIREQEGWVITAVEDHGPGIPANELDRLFKPFGRTSVQSSNGEKSTGLGLAIARRIIEGHYGKIWVESQVGQGSTFYFSLPLAAT